MPSITIHPRLFSTTSPFGQNVVVSEGDSTVVTLYELYINRLANTSSWRYRKQVLAAAQRLFGKMDEWLYTQSNNPQVRGYNIEYITDTLNFIRTGQRELSNETWIEILHEQDDVQQGAPDARGPKSFFELRAGEDTPQLLARWCSHPDGFQDLVCTLFVLFGKSRRTLAR